MVEEIGRRLVNGVWVTNVASEGGGGGGGSVPFVGDDPPGSPADGDLWWDTDDETAPDGGSQPGIQVVRVPIAFDTPNLAVTGIDAYAPQVGDVILWAASYLSVTTAFDFTDPSTGIFLSYTFSDYASAFNSSDLTVEDQPDPPLVEPAYVNPYGGSGNVVPRYFSTATPLRIIMADDAGADPGATIGAGEFVLFVAAVA